MRGKPLDRARMTAMIASVLITTTSPAVSATEIPIVKATPVNTNPPNRGPLPKRRKKK